MKKTAFLTTIIALVLLSLLNVAAYAQPTDELYQVSTINALMQGVYDGEQTVKDLKQHGDFGLGAPNRLDGELIALDGKFYQIQSTGKVVLLNDSMKIPFGTVMHFKAKQPETIGNIASFREFENRFDNIIKEKNYFYAIRMDGVFDYVKTRSIPPQNKPYKTLSEAAKEQNTFELHNVKGTIVGFWAPQYVNGVNLPGYHLHFISDDRQSGGHILDLRFSNATYQLNKITNFYMSLPHDGDFRQINLQKDLSKELKKVEN